MGGSQGISDRHACKAALARRFDKAAWLEGADIPARNLHDAGYLPPTPPLGVVRPNDPQGFADAMAICASHGVPVVPQAGLTGLAGGAQPIAGAVAISFERFSGIEEIDPASATMTVRAGTPLEVVQRAADEAGFFIPLDLGARGSCLIGGNLGTNAGGNRVIRYGMAREMVLGLEYVLPDGTLVTGLNKMIKNNAGYDLKQLFMGSEGTLGMITRAVLRLYPKPGCTCAAICGLARYDDVLALLGAARRGLGPMLSAFEVMWADYWHEATVTVPNVRRPITGDHAFYVLVEMQGMEAELDAPRFEAWLETQFEAGLIEDAAIAQSMADVAAFWRTRDAAGEFVTFLGRHSSFDIGLPVGVMDQFAQECRAALSKALPGCLSVYYGHIGDGNMHIVALMPGAAEQPGKAISEIVYRTVKAHGGTISAEHGIGLVKKPYLALSRSKGELALMRRLKRALDPQGLLNPGKVIDLEEAP
ncbi:FAD-binding oxidoreductase [Paracoccus lutimaris]|uniref:FAD/FMN-containing dehydrogenase n=1 Tax=Paracoccus lutimaris TaxID=1490030 RepID=A0A368Z964_9RHOB|nr:FAD-binding oxidoreductase [Paracoccus lutimaris]RCW87004.1 FAD/FMN-containing dehydrogenase [Paracoccus lutimaris]